MKRFENIRDYIEIKCKKCGSSNVELSVNECVECGSIIECECNDCKAEYNYHDLMFIDK